jgi:adenosine deaminase
VRETLILRAEFRPCQALGQTQSERRDVETALRIPKVHLHCHLEGSLRPESFVELATKHAVPLRYEPSDNSFVVAPNAAAVDPGDAYRFKDFREFLLGFAAVSRSLAEPADYARLAREFVEDALEQNVMYGELFISPSVWTIFHKTLNVREAVEAIVTELRRARPRAEFRLIIDLTRNFGAERAMQTARLAATLTDLDVVGVGLGGDEARFGPELFVEAFEYARAQGFQRVAHAGEAAGPQSVRDAVLLLGARRIGHGLAALQDKSTLDLLAANEIALEICPTSNVITGAALPGRHAFLEFERAGCIVTIDADDPPMFGTSITREYAIVEAVVGAAGLRRYVHNAIDVSFADESLKAALRQRLAAAGLELEAPR